MLHQSNAGAIDLNLLRTFVAVADSGSFTAAAERLGGPRSTVSRNLAALEEALGVRLFHRTTRSVAPTTAGAEFYLRAAPALAALEATLVGLPEREEEPSGTLRVTSTGDLGSVVLAEVVARFVQRYPLVKVELHFGAGLVDLARDGFDLALRILQKPPRDSAMVAKKVGQLRLGLYAAPNYVARRGTPKTLDDLAVHDQVRFNGMAQLTLRGKSKLPGHARIVCDDMFFTRETLKSGAGVGVLPSFLAAPELAAGTLVRVLPRWLALTGTVYLVHPGGKHVPKKLLAFRELVTEALRQRPLAVD